jgi:catechol 2,3-dioxygenase-like lactoylglutathione lyase family enzyme
VKQSIGAVTLLVRDYDEAISFYTTKLRFELAEDTPIGDGKRWVLLASVGRQAGGRVFLFLHTDDFGRDYREMRRLGVKFNEQPRHEAYGAVAVFEDLYGNKWDLIMLKPRGADEGAG